MYLRLRSLILSCLLILVIPALAETSQPPTYPIEKTKHKIIIDGTVNPDEWRGATRIALNFEIEPGENIPPQVQTTAYITYDNEHLYVGFIASDPDPASIRGRITDRDRAWQDDFCGIALDPFNDQRRGYEFFVNPYGVQMDMKRVEGAGDDAEDSSWDTIWESAGRITDSGYMVEFAIPFRSISFPGGDQVQDWGFWFFRAYPRDFRYQISNVPFNRDMNCFFCQISKVSGFKGIHPGGNLELNPTYTAAMNSRRDGFGEPIIDNGNTSQLGMNIRWTPTTNITLNAALNPDFSQVEADSAQLSFNRQFSLFLEEKRPFFLEGADIFETLQQHVHTRSIVDPSYGAKASGKSGKYAWGMFMARDTVTNILLPGNNRSSYVSLDMENTAYVARVRRDVLNNSTIGALITHRTGDGYHNTVAAIDGRIFFTPRDKLEFQFAGTDTRNPVVANDPRLDGSSASGFGYDIHFEHEDRDWEYHLWHERRDADFRSDTGFIPMTSYTDSGAALERVFYGKDGAFISRIIPEGRVDIVHDLDGKQLSRTFSFRNNIRMAGQSYLGFFYDMEMRHHEGLDHYYHNYGFWAGATAKWITVESMCAIGENLDFTNNQLGDWLMIELETTFLLGDRSELQLDWEQEHLKIQGKKLFTAKILQGKFIYNFNNRMFVRAILQYITLDLDHSLYNLNGNDPAHERSLIPQLLFSYKINPRTLLYAGYSGRREGTSLDPTTTFDRTLFFKIAYAWHL